MNKCIHWEEKPFNTCSVNGKDFYCVKCLWEISKNKQIEIIAKRDILNQEDDIEDDIDFGEDELTGEIEYDKELNEYKMNRDPVYFRFDTIEIDTNDVSDHVVLLCPRLYGYSILDSYYRFSKLMGYIRCKIIEWTELDKLAFSSQLLINDNENKKRKIEKCEIDLPSIFEFMVERFLKGFVYWIEGIHNIIWGNSHSIFKDYPCVQKFFYIKWILSKFGIILNTKKINSRIEWGIILIYTLIQQKNEPPIEYQYIPNKFYTSHMKNQPIESSKLFIDLKISPFSKFYKIKVGLPILGFKSLTNEWIHAEKNHKNLIYILLERKNNSQSLFYKDYLPMDMFKIIVKMSNLAYFNE
jgi:hypothetical protein